MPRHPKSTRRHSSSHLILTGTFIWLGAAPATAQDNRPAVGTAGVDQGDLVVTATKREQRINDIGASITALSGDQITRLGIKSSSQIAQQTIGLYFAEGPLSHIPLSNIRGVSQNDFTGNLETPNAVYIDQAYISFQGATTFKLYDIERVEIAKGPQGTLFGRNATGGLIQYLTKAPSEDFGGYVTGGAGGLGMFSGEGAITGKIADGLSARLSGIYSGNDAYVENRTGPDLMRARDWGVRGQLKWNPVTGLTDRLIVSYSRQNHNHDFQHRSTGFDPISGLEYPLSANVNLYGNCAGCDPSGFADQDGNPFKSAQNSPGLYTSRTINATNLLTASLSDSVDLNAVTNYVRYRYFYQEDSDLSPRFGLLGQRGGRYNQLSQELRLNGHSQDLRWVLGGYFLSRNTHDTADQAFGLSWLDDIYSALGAISPGDLSSLGTTDRLLSRFEMLTRSYAGFGQVEYDFAPRWTVIGGIRYSYDDIHYHFASTEDIDGVPTDAGAIGTTTFTDATAGRLTRNRKGEWSGQFALNFRPVDGLLTYLSYNRANKAGAWNAPFTGGSVTPLKEEVLTSIEGGFKWKLLGGKLQINGTIFHYFYDGYQGFIFENFATKLTNMNAHLTGAETEINVSPGQGWRFTLGAGYLDTVADTNVPTATGSRNSRLPYAPHWTFKGVAEKRIPLTAGILTLTADGSYTGSRFSDVLNSPAGHLSSRVIGNFGVAFAPAGTPLEMSVLVRNVGDDRKPIMRIPTGLGFTQDMYDQPTYAMVQASLHF